MKNIKDYINYIVEAKSRNPAKDASPDLCHLLLLFGTVLSQKPTDILEVGLGPCASTMSILAALKYNQKPFNYTAVDNLYDLGGNLQQGMIDLLKEEKVNIVISEEEKFIKECPDNSYDLCISDGDHMASGNWSKEYLRVCRNGGIIFAHDVTNEGYPTLKNYITMCQELNLPYRVFNEKSRPDEGCKTGFIMIFNKK